MIKCFECIKLEKHNKLRWSQVLDGVVVLAGNSYCYEHLKKEVGWDNDTRQGKDNIEVKPNVQMSQPVVCIDGELHEYKEINLEEDWIMMCLKCGKERGEA